MVRRERAKWKSNKSSSFVFLGGSGVMIRIMFARRTFYTNEFQLNISMVRILEMKVPRGENAQKKVLKNTEIFLFLRKIN
jgi:hypothetical protein